jgi:predicted secreted hydrolase
MDHEWFSNPLDESQQGWDWFSAQLDNGAELMLFQLRRKDGSIDPFSAGTYIDAGGHARHLRRGDFDLRPGGLWTSPRTGARYPLRWHISVPAPGIELDCAAALADQELVSKGPAAPTYWEGAVTYSGSAAGAGYLEMTGYAGPMRL